MKYIKKLKKFLLDCFRWYNHIIRKKTFFNIPLFIRIRYALKGFNANEYVYFNFKKNDYREYISDFSRIRSRDINGAYKVILDNKLLFEEIFGKYVKVPAIYGWINNGNIFGLHGHSVDNDTFFSFIQEKKKVVLKWETGFEGKGTYIIEANQGSYNVNGKEVDASYLEKILKYHGNAILCEYMHQSDFENELYPYATNTIRIICAKEKGSRTTRVIKAAQRIGNHESAPVDNVSAGAISCEIDIETGVLMQGVIAKAHQMTDDKKFFDNHPDTGAQLAGKQIPNWCSLKAEVERVTNQFPYLNLVAWDVLLLNDGFCLIEGNSSSGLMMFQQRHGVRNEEIGDIYRSYGILK